MFEFSFDLKNEQEQPNLSSVVEVHGIEAYLVDDFREVPSPLFQLSIDDVATTVRGHKNAVCADLKFSVGIKTYSSLGQGEWEPMVQKTAVDVMARQQVSVCERERTHE